LCAIVPGLRRPGPLRLPKPRPLTPKPSRPRPLRQKIVSSPPTSTHSKGCIDSLRADQEVRINASALYSTSSLVISLDFVSVPNTPLKALVDAGSTHCFIESALICKYNIPTRSIPPIPLRLFDGSINSQITESIELPNCFPSHDTFSVYFYVTSLDSSCLVVLGHNWLT
jgi:hypothetical protein